MSCFSQKLRAQEAAQAEAEDREDLEIAAEMAGTPHQTRLPSEKPNVCCSVESWDITHPHHPLPSLVSYMSLCIILF